MKLPRFTLRELFLLVVIAAMGCGSWVRERDLRAQSNATADKLRFAQAVIADRNRRIAELRFEVAVQAAQGRSDH